MVGPYELAMRIFHGFLGNIILGADVVTGVLVYQDAEKRSMNGILWFILIIIP